MTSQLFPVDPALKVYYNTQRVGLIQDYSILTQWEVTPIRSFGTEQPHTLHQSAPFYTVTLKRLMLDRAFVPSQIAPYGTENFQLTIEDNHQSIAFYNCQWERIQQSYHLGESIFEEMRLVSANCLRSTLN